MATFTSTTFANQQPKGLHVGNMSTSGQIVLPFTGTAPSAGDVGFLCKIPHGAVVIDFLEDHTCADTIGIDFGFATGAPGASGSASFSNLISGGAKSTLNRRAVVNTGGGVTISVSDADPNRYGILACKVASGSLTASVTINWTVWFRNDGS
jgi:hypothetical protein